MRCELCNTNTRCSCKGGGCPTCHNNNKTISVTNDLIKFWLSKDIIKEKMSFIKGEVWKIDTFTLYEFINWDIDEDKFLEAKAKHKPSYNGSIYWNKVEANWINPNKQCVYKKPWVWERCIYCNLIKKYQIWKECPRFKDNIKDETPGTTDA